VLQRLQHEHGGSFTEDKTGSVGVKGPAGFLRGVVVAGRQHCHRLKAGNSVVHNHRFNSAGKDHVGTVIADEFRAITDALRSRRASRRLAGQGAGRVQLAADVMGWHVRQTVDQAERAGFVPMFARLVAEGGLLDDFMAAQAGADNDTGPLAHCRDVFACQPGILHGHAGNDLGHLR